MRSAQFIFAFFFGAMLFSCSDDGNAEQLKAKELELKERELELREKEMNEAKQNGADNLNESEEKDFKLKWANYYNDRFEFCVDYPMNYLFAQGEPENNDGNTFSTTNRSSEMQASGMYNALEQSISEAFIDATAKSVYYDDERKITYKAQNANWFVISGKYNESIFYVKTVLKGDTFYTLYFEYFPTERKKFDEIIKRATKDFPKC